MSQLTLYLDPETAQRMREAAQAAGVSQSRWVAELIRQKTAQEWPQQVRALVGSWDDSMPSAEEIRRSMAADVERETF